MSTTYENKYDARNRVSDYLLNNQERILIGIVGKPGAGKSTLSTFLLSELPSELVTVVPMDGYHLSNKVLVELGKRDRKGAPDTFDVAGFVTLIKRIRDDVSRNIYYPVFERGVEESISAQGVITPATRVVIIEGNYLLHNESGWEEIGTLLNEKWFVEVDDEVRKERLIARHITFGKDPIAARNWALGTDEVNAQLIERGKSRADVIVREEISPIR